MIVSCSFGSPALSPFVLVTSLSMNASAIGRSTMILPGRHADLTLVQERAERRGVDRVVEVGVAEHDQRVRAAELEHDALEVATRRLGELAADRGRAGEVDAAHLRVLDELVADLLRPARAHA